MRKQPLSDKQLEIYKFIKSFCKKNGFSPTYIEIGEAMQMSDAGAFDVVKKLEEKGYVKRDRRPRTLKVL